MFVLGGGSNIVIADSGFNGLVIAMRISGIMTEKHGDRLLLVTVGAGVVWDDFVVWTIGQSLSGLECMSGVPGTVGGAVVANVGAYGAQVSDTFVRAEVIDTQDENHKVQVIKKRSATSHITTAYSAEQRGDMSSYARPSRSHATRLHCRRIGTIVLT